MIIAGLQKTTLIDYPGKVAATVFTRGCSFRCGFCHNPELVLPEQFIPEMDEEEVFKFLEGRRGKLEGICITGGEPLLFLDTKDFMRRVQAMGFAVKLDTNGSFPDQLEKILAEGLANYVAMDIKSPLEKYPEVTQAINAKSLKENIKKSIKMIMESGVDYEFRTTIAKPLHEMADFELMGKMIKGAKRYFIQNFQKSKQINEAAVYLPFSDEELAEAKKIMEKYVEEVGRR